MPNDRIILTPDQVKAVVDMDKENKRSRAFWKPKGITLPPHEFQIYTEAGYREMVTGAAGQVKEHIDAGEPYKPRFKEYTDTLALHGIDKTIDTVQKDVRAAFKQIHGKSLKAYARKRRREKERERSM
jgi:hypothetical protein